MSLEYQELSLPNLALDEVGYNITGTEQCASVRVLRAPGLARHMFGIAACAFALDVNGLPTLTADGNTIEGWATMSCQKADLIVDGAFSPAKVAEMKAAVTEQALVAMLNVTASEEAFDLLNV